ncbi:MAG: hypothetical protein MR886_05910 [Clostridium sp.]|nr:hypothetical protein [Clostridium sp.]
MIFYAVPVKNFSIATEQHAFFLTLLFLRSKTFAQTGGTNPLLTLNTAKPVLIFNTDTVLSSESSSTSTLGITTSAKL